MRDWNKLTVTRKKKLLWEVFTKYIKMRDNWTCVTCGKQAKGYGMGGGHYIAKGACGAEYYFHERNVHAQCTDCNLRLEGNRPAYREFIIKKYGDETLLDLENNYWKPCKDYPYEEKYRYYTSLVEAH
jgi:hypothetical protein